MKRSHIATLFLSLFGLMIIVSTVDHFHNLIATTDVTSSLDWDSESESEDTEKEIEDVDKIITRTYTPLFISSISILDKQVYQRIHTIHGEIHSPPPELS